VGLLTPLIVTAVLVAPPGASGATPATYTLRSGLASVKTQNGQSWMLSLFTFSLAPGGALVTDASIARAVNAGGTGTEFHTWGVSTSASTFSFNSSTSRATLNTGTQGNPVLIVDVTFQGTSKKKGVCKTGSEWTYSGTLSGKVEVTTGLTGGGTVGGSAVSFSGTSTLTADTGCVPPPSTPACSSGVGWLTNTSPWAGGAPLTLNGRQFDYVVVSRNTPLKSPRNAQRTDEATINAAPAPFTKGKLNVTTGTSASSIVTGSATLSGGVMVDKRTDACTAGGKSHTETETDYNKVKYVSPAGKSITVHDSLGGALVVPAPVSTATMTVFSFR
jgi:hypothetical protein